MWGAGLWGELLSWDSIHRAYWELFLSSPEEDWERLFPWEPLPRSPVFSQEGWIRKIRCVFPEFIMSPTQWVVATLSCKLPVRY